MLTALSSAIVISCTFEEFWNCVLVVARSALVSWSCALVLINSALVCSSCAFMASSSLHTLDSSAVGCLEKVTRNDE